MLWRSCSVAPRTVFARISMPRPSGYCGATRRTRHRGRASASSNNPDASVRSSLESFDMVNMSLRLGGSFAAQLGLRLLADVGHELDVRPGGRDADVAL